MDSNRIAQTIKPALHRDSNVSVVERREVKTITKCAGNISFEIKVESRHLRLIYDDGKTFKITIEEEA